MPSIDYWHPDIVWGNKNCELVYGNKYHYGSIWQTPNGQFFVVYGYYEYSPAINIAGGWTWFCPCEYYPWQSDNPPLPGQKCYNCGSPLADWIGENNK